MSAGRSIELNARPSSAYVVRLAEAQSTLLQAAAQFQARQEGEAAPISQAFLLRRRLRFSGEIRATGDVLIDQLLQMQRTGFDSAVLRADQNPTVAKAQLERFAGFYQGDAKTLQPVFARGAAA